MTDAGTDTHDFGAAIRATAQTLQAPHGLRTRIEAQRADTARRSRLRRPLLGFAGAGIAAVVVALVLALGGSSTAPTLGQAASAALRPASGPAPAEDQQHRGLLRAAVDGVRFPQWEYKFQWYPSGTRYDDIGDRRATTVFYDGRGVRIGYTIVPGKALKVPHPDRVITRNGEDYAVLRRGDATIVTWQRNGHTCVLAGRGVPADRMVALAAWDGRTASRA